MSAKTGFLRTHFKAILLGVVALIIAGAFTVPSVDAVINGRHKPVHFFRNISSDEKHQITVTRRVALPANDVMDPAVIATFTLKDHATGKELETQEVKLAKESALQEPLVLWNGSSVEVKKFDALEDRTLSFRRSPL
jgi:hypothetical protein